MFYMSRITHKNTPSHADDVRGWGTVVTCDCCDLCEPGEQGKALAPVEVHASERKDLNSIFRIHLRVGGIVNRTHSCTVYQCYVIVIFYGLPGGNNPPLLMPKTEMCLSMPFPSTYLWPIVSASFLKRCLQMWKILALKCWMNKCWNVWTLSILLLIMSKHSTLLCTKDTGAFHIVIFTVAFNATLYHIFDFIFIFVVKGLGELKSLKYIFNKKLKCI